MNETLDPGSWQYRGLNARAPSLSTLADTLNALADEGHPVVAVTADLQYSNGLIGFARKHPERLFQFGISEQNMVSAAAGLATTGFMPFTATFASFLALLCCEQIRTDIAYSALPVRLIGHHAGISLGFYGTSHHATEDLAIMRSIADLTVVSPADGAQFSAAIRASMTWPQPIYFRIARGHDPVVYGTPAPFEFGKAIVHEEGEDLTIIACGTMVHPSLEAVKRLRAAGRSVGLIDMHTIKPLDRVAIVAASRRSKCLMTVEEHNVLGGLGGAVAEVLADLGGAPRLVRHGIMDEYSLIAPPTHLYAHYELDAKGIESRALAAIANQGLFVTIKPLVTDNLSSRAYTSLRNALIDGDFLPGERLVMHDIADRLGTSVTPVREACLRLVSEKGLEIRSGRFLNVPDLDLGRYLEIRKMRIALEGLATEEGAAKVIPQDIARLADIHRRFLKSSHAHDNFSTIRLNREFHFGVYQLSGMKMLMSQIENLWVSMGPILKVYYREHADDHYLGAEEHVNVMSALERRDGRAAREALVGDIERGGEGILAYLGKRPVSAAGQPTFRDTAVR